MLDDSPALTLFLIFLILLPTGLRGNHLARFA